VNEEEARTPLPALKMNRPVLVGFCREEEESSRMKSLRVA